MSILHNVGSGPWTDKNTWATEDDPPRSFVPGSNTDVVMDADAAASPTVTLAGNGEAKSVVIGSANTLALTGGNISAGRINLAPGTLLAQSGVNSASSITNEGGTVTVAAGATLNLGFGKIVNGSGNVAVAGSLNLNFYRAGDASGSLEIADKGTVTLNSLLNAGAISLNSTGNDARLVWTSGTQRLSSNIGSVLDNDYKYQGGTVTLSDSAKNQLFAPNTLEIVNNTVSGAGQLDAQTLIIDGAVGDGSHNGDHSQGVINATGANNALKINLLSTRNLKNGSLMEGSGAAGLEVFGTSGAKPDVTNTGSIQANAGSSVKLANLQVHNTGGTIQTTGAAGKLFLGNIQVTGGTLASVADSEIRITDPAVISNATLNSAGDFAVLNGATLKLTGDVLNFSGDITNTGAVTFDTDMKWTGAHFENLGTWSSADKTLEIVNGTVSGSGKINVENLTNDAGGHIEGPLTLTVESFQNAGSISGATVINVGNELNNDGSISGATIKGVRLDNRGAISDATFVSGLTVQGQGSTNVITNSSFGAVHVVSGLIQAVGAGKQTVFAGTDVSANVLSSSNGGVVRIDNNPTATTLDVNAVAAGTNFVVDNGAQVEFDNFSSSPRTFDNVTFHVNGTNQTTELRFKTSFADLPAILKGGSKLTLSDSAANHVFLGGQLALENGTISGAGSITGSSSVSAPILDIKAGGTLVANGKNKLSIELASIRNDGVLEADAGRLEVVTGSPMDGTGTVLATNGGTVDLSGTPQFEGTLRYQGKGTIIGPGVLDVFPHGEISGFSTDDTYVFGAKSNVSDPLTTDWTEDFDNSGGVLTIKSGADLYASLDFSDGLYDTTDFTATQVSLSDGKHVVVNFTGPLRWLQPVTGNWNTAAKWGPTGQFAPGANDDALITASGGTYAVNVTQDTTVKTVATGDGATLDIEAGTFTITGGTKSTANAGTVKVETGAGLVMGGTFQQTGNGRVQAASGGNIDFAKDGRISGGRVVIATGATLNAKSGDDGLDNVTVRDDGKISILKGASLTLTGGSVVGQGSFDVADGATLALANGSVSAGNTINLAGKLQVNTSSTLMAPVAMAAGSAIVGGASPATLTNGAGAIAGFGTIGSANLTLVNQAKITTAPAGTGKLTIDTGANVVANGGTMSALAGGQMVVNSALSNTFKFDATGGSARFNAGVTNGGSMSANGAGSIMAFQKVVANSGKITATAGGTVVLAGAVTQQSAGILQATGGGSKIDLDGGGGVSGGQIVLRSGAELTVTGAGPSVVSQSTISIDSPSQISLFNANALLLQNTVVNSKGEVEIGVKSVLGLADTTLNGGSYGLGGTLVQVGGTGTVLNGTDFNLEHGSKFVSNGAAATLTNAGSIDGAGLTIGDANLTFVNNGTVAPEPGGDITIDTDTNAVVNNGTIGTSDVNSKVDFGSLVSNTAEGKLLASAGLMVTLQVNNAGLIDASGGGHIEIQGGLFNSGTVMAENGGTLESLGTNNSGKAKATGAGSTMTLGNESNTAINSGQIFAENGGTVIFEHGVNNVSGGQLVANAGGVVNVTGAASGGIAKIIGQGAVMDFEGDGTASTTTNAVFVGVDDGQLLLNNSARFAGTVAGLEQGDTIDVKDVAFVAGMSSFNPSSAILTVTDGTHAAHIQLLGQFQANQFAFASDGHGGTRVTDTF